MPCFHRGGAGRGLGNWPHQQFPGNSVCTPTSLPAVATAHLGPGPVPAPGFGIDPIASGLRGGPRRPRRGRWTITAGSVRRSGPGRWDSLSRPFGSVASGSPTWFG